MSTSRHKVSPLERSKTAPALAYPQDHRTFKEILPRNIAPKSMPFTNPAERRHCAKIRTIKNKKTCVVSSTPVSTTRRGCPIALIGLNASLSEDMGSAKTSRRRRHFRTRQRLLTLHNSEDPFRSRDSGKDRPRFRCSGQLPSAAIPRNLPSLTGRAETCATRRNCGGLHAVCTYRYPKVFSDTGRWHGAIRMYQTDGASRWWTLITTKSIAPRSQQHPSSVQSETYQW